MKVECPKCKCDCEIDYFHKCKKCGELVCFACFNGNEKKCCDCEDQV